MLFWFSVITNFSAGLFFSRREAGRGTLMLPVLAAPSSCGPSLVMPITWVWDVYPSLPLPFINLSRHSPRKWVRRSAQKIFEWLNSTKNYSFQTILKNLFVRRWGVWSGIFHAAFWNDAQWRAPLPKGMSWTRWSGFWFFSSWCYSLL